MLLSAYRFFVPESYQEQDALGHFRDPARRMELEIVVHEPVPIIDLETADQNHIRWAALEVKQSLRQRLTSPVITKSSSYEKRPRAKLSSSFLLLRGMLGRTPATGWVPR